MMSALAIRVCQVARATTLLLDQGHQLDVLEVRRHVVDGDLLPWLDRRYPQHNLRMSDMATVDQAAIQELFENMGSAHVDRKYGVYSNGLCALLAFAIEGIQQFLNEPAGGPYRP